MSQLIIPLKLDQATTDSISSKAPIADPTFTTGITTPKATLTGASIITSPVNGNLLLQNNAATDFSLIQLGGATAAFPAIKRVGTGLQIRLSDDTAFSGLTAGTLFLNDGTVKQVTYGAVDSAGLGFKVLRIPN